MILGIHICRVLRGGWGREAAKDEKETGDICVYYIHDTYICICIHMYIHIYTHIHILECIHGTPR